MVALGVVPLTRRQAGVWGGPWALLSERKSFWLGFDVSSRLWEIELGSV